MRGGGGCHHQVAERLHRTTLHHEAHVRTAAVERQRAHRPRGILAHLRVSTLVQKCSVAVETEKRVLFGAHPRDERNFEGFCNNKHAGVETPSKMVLDRLEPKGGERRA